MLEIFDLLKMVFMILLDAIADYDQTEHGHAAIEALLERVEADGFDIPFWEPEETTEEPIDLNVSSEAVQSAVDAIAKRWLSRHPQSGQSGEGV